MTIIAFLTFLFGPNLIDRLGPIETSEESRSHATYSFKKEPFVHPKIVGDLVGSLSDLRDQVVAINLLDSQGSNRYFGDIFATPQDDPMVPSWPWVYTLEDRGSNTNGNEDPDTLWGREVLAYRFLGSTQSGLDVLHFRYSGGGSGRFNTLVFIQVETDSGADYPPPGDAGGRQAMKPEFRRRELVRLAGKILLGDRWLGTVEVSGDDVVVRGRHLEERCEAGGVSVMEAIEMNYFTGVDCKEGGPDHPPPARVYKAPAVRQTQSR
ncbi:MAG: hypothetical protein OXN97_12365 [Bryobacterales bacterium]|nr:hypothetical protein [Bryobacterales bacterium]